MKITFIGAGSVSFAKNVLGDCLSTDSLRDSTIALYDINSYAVKQSELIIGSINETMNENRATIRTYCGEQQRREALKDADFVIIAIRVGSFEEATVRDFEIPSKYGLKQTVSDTLGIGGLMKGLRTIPVMEEMYAEMEQVCPDAYVLNYTNPMAIVSGYFQKYSNMKTFGLCHSVQACAPGLLRDLDMKDKIEDHRATIVGINHMAWLLEIYDGKGNDLYPEIRRRAIKKNEQEKHNDMVRYEYIRWLDYYCTESSKHNAEYSSWFIKSHKPELVDKYNIPLDSSLTVWPEFQKKWEELWNEFLSGKPIIHNRSNEYASRIMEAIITNKSYQFNLNILNTGRLVTNLPEGACVEVPCLVNGMGVHPTWFGALPEQCASMNRTNINMQLLTIIAAKTRKRDDVYRAALLDPHTSAELAPDEIKQLCDELIKGHGELMSMY